MKKILIGLMVLVMLFVVAGCEKPGDSGAKPSDSPEDNNAQTERFSFVYQNVELIPGADFPEKQLPEAASVYTVPSCAMEGTDNVYNYEVIEVTAFQDRSGESIYSIYLLDANTPTPEGLYLGDDLSRVTELYGTTYQQDGTQISYQKGDTLLVLILQENCVSSIEYRMAI